METLGDCNHHTIKTKKMKKNILILAALLSASCAKEKTNEGPGKEICFVTSGLEVEVETKVEEVTMENLESFNVAAITATNPDEIAWTAVAQRSGNRYHTGKYWPLTNPVYRFYASNYDIAIDSGAPCTIVDRSLDAVCGAMTNPSFNAESTTIVMRHIFSRIGRVSVTSEYGYTLSDVSVKLTSVRTGGKYSLKTFRWYDCTSRDNVALQIGDNDILVVPDTAEIEVSYTMTKGDYSHSFVSTSNVTFMEGKICDLNLNVKSDPAIPVRVIVSLAPWETRQLPVVLQ